ncbi:MAG: imidazole glycerol phosphate synthase subunit HisH [Acidiferrobacteraceae bacterium]|nr:imidazole glycerol phosphate synthase subunit HisH [Acidiferrobacteraceae bacterium]|tara:strand:- start:2766 stop:3389 length:624 start_codon:yes stop_codon:yes gene_type:complete
MAMGTIVGVIEYGAGNLFSVETMLSKIGAEFFVSSEPKELNKATHLILPGVGSFNRAMDNLDAHGLSAMLVDIVEKKRKKLLGICLGMQLLATYGQEGGERKGLGLVGGTIAKLPPARDVRVPHIGWNSLHFGSMTPKSFSDISEGQTVYFNHSYYFELEEQIPHVYTEHGVHKIIAAFEKDTVLGLQFHPEKSQVVGQKILSSFLS